MYDDFSPVALDYVNAIPPGSYVLEPDGEDNWFRIAEGPYKGRRVKGPLPPSYKASRFVATIGVQPIARSLDPEDAEHRCDGSCGLPPQAANTAEPPPYSDLWWRQRTTEWHRPNKGRVSNVQHGRVASSPSPSRLIRHRHQHEWSTPTTEAIGMSIVYALLFLSLIGFIYWTGHNHETKKLPIPATSGENYRAQPLRAAQQDAVSLPVPDWESLREVARDPHGGTRGHRS